MNDRGTGITADPAGARRQLREPDPDRTLQSVNPGTGRRISDGGASIGGAATAQQRLEGKLSPERLVRLDEDRTARRGNDLLERRRVNAPAGGQRIPRLHGEGLLGEDRTRGRIPDGCARVEFDPASSRVELRESCLDRTFQRVDGRSVCRVLDGGAEAAPDPAPAGWRRRDDIPDGGDPLPEDRSRVGVLDRPPGVPLDPPGAERRVVRGDPHPDAASAVLRDRSPGWAVPLQEHRTAVGLRTGPPGFHGSPGAERGITLGGAHVDATGGRGAREYGAIARDARGDTGVEMFARNVTTATPENEVSELFPRQQAVPVEDVTRYPEICSCSTGWRIPCRHSGLT